MTAGRDRSVNSDRVASRGRDLYRHLVLGFSSALCLAAATSLPAQSGLAETELRDRQVTLEVRLDELLRHLPPLGRELVDRRQAAVEDALGVRFHIRQLSEPERLKTAAGDSLPIKTLRLEIHGRQPIGVMRDWMTQMDDGFTIQWVEKLELRAHVAGAVDLTATLVIAGYSAEEPDLDDSTRPYRRSHEVARLETLVATIEALRERPGLRDSALMLAVADVAAGGRGARWTELRLADGRLELEGVAAGARAWDGLRQRLADAGLAIEARHHAEAGCHRGTLSAQSGTVSDEARYSTASGPSFHPDPWAACLALPTGKLTHLEPESGASGDFELYLRDLRAADLFQVLHRLGGGNYVIDGGLGGRLSGDLVAVTESSVLDSLRSVPIHVTPGSLRRVSETAVSDPGSESSGEPISIDVRHASTAYMLCLLGQLESRDVRVPAGLDRQVDLIAKDVPHGLLVEGLLATAGLSRESHEGRWLISEQAASGASELVDACNLDQGDAFPAVFQDQKELTVEDLRLAATARRGDAWKAFAYAPGGDLVNLSIDSELSNATVQAIDRRGITLKTAAGARRLPLPE